MAIVKVAELAYGRLRAPDLDLMEEFLVHFGMTRAARTADALYMRGTDARHHIHVTELGEAAFVGFAYLAQSRDDLERLAARAPGASAVEAIEEPGGGHRVRLTEPNGYAIEVVHGIETPAAIPVARQALNSGAEPLRRAGEVLRLPASPSPVKRIGHGVLATPEVVGTASWFRDTLGFLRSDDVYVAEEANIAGLGKYEHMWGIGRHILGSQIFDYWCDPWGRVHERWADTDRLNAASGGNLTPAEIGFASQWGPDAPEKFITHSSP